MALFRYALLCSIINVRALTSYLLRFLLLSLVQMFRPLFTTPHTSMYTLNKNTTCKRASECKQTKKQLIETQKIKLYSTLCAAL